MKNPQIKKAHAIDEYTPEMIQDLVRCKNDPVYFMENFIKVQHPTKGNIPFKLFEYQKRFIRHLQQNRFTITLQPRQCGKCFQVETTINTVKKPTGLKKLLLKFLDRKTYNNLFPPLQRVQR